MAGKRSGGKQQADGGQPSQSECVDGSPLAVSLLRRLCVRFCLQPCLQGDACAGIGHMTCEQDVRNLIPCPTFFHDGYSVRWLLRAGATCNISLCKTESAPKQI